MKKDIQYNGHEKWTTQYNGHEKRTRQTMVTKPYTENLRLSIKKPAKTYSGALEG